MVPPPRADAPAVRTVHLASAEADIFNAMFREASGLRLLPNRVFVDHTGKILFETNEVGFKGDPIDPHRQLAVVWGDSVAFSTGRGWPCLLDELAPGYQFLNGGLDGDPYDNILRRARLFNSEHRVALNLMMLGWHPFLPERTVQRPRLMARLFGGMATVERQLGRGGNRGLGEALDTFLIEVPNTVVLTMPTAVNAAIADIDLSPSFNPDFRFLGRVGYKPGAQRQALAHILERNAITRDICAARGVRFVDLYAALDTTQVPDFRRHFRDILHLHPASYRVIAQIVYDGIKDLLRRPA
ncbi:MAG: SGNH/GDSL hydrolase family protein [Alphaproteobacteria bacterium]|nr:SGNH/GDSL hydrolase family protein [Alphaproteobacteria bacterium]